MNKQLFIVFITILLVSCQSQEKKNTVTEDFDLKGNWEYQGFGKAITVTDSIVKGYHLSSAGNVRLSDTSVEDYLEYYTLDTISNDIIQIRDGVKTFVLHKTEEDFDSKINDSLANDPEYNFEVLWNTFNEQYCYFKERKVKWNELYDKYKPQIASDTEPLALFLIFEKMLGEINDGHISINVPGALEEAYNNNEVIDTTPAEEEEEEEEEVPGKLEKKVKNLIIDKHLSDVKEFNQGELKWGKVTGNISYIQTSNMVFWAHYKISDTLSKDDFWSEWWDNLNNAKNYHDDIAQGTRFMMDSIVNDISDSDALIIDLRFNGGGFDDASVEILNHLVTKKTDFATKKVRKGKGYTEKQVMTLTPSNQNFKGTIYILTSHLTASAAEVIVLGSMEIPNAKRIGSTTEGVFSDILRKKLPNGWTYGLSNMIYESMDGISYEEKGITPDYELAYPKTSKELYKYLLNDIKNGDDAIEKVIALENK